MKSATRPRTGPRRGLALLATALLLTAAITTPALGQPEDPGDVTTSSAGGKSCPQDAPWIKIDDIDGRAGSYPADADEPLLSWSGGTVSFDVPEGHVLDLCLKSGVKSGMLDPYTFTDLTGTGQRTTQLDPEENKLQDISHLSFWLRELPPPPAPQDGSVTLTKQVTGDGDHPDEAFTFTVVDDEGAPLTDPIHLEDGQSSTAIPVPAGTILTVTETATHDADATTWNANATSGTGTATSPLTINEDDHLTITFTNHYDAVPTVDGHGDLVVSKVVVDETGEVADDATFEVDIACTYGDVSFGWSDRIGHDESLGPFLDLPAGTVCTITETDAGGADAVAIDGEDGNSTTLTIEADELHEVEIVNTYLADDEPDIPATPTTPTAPPTPTAPVIDTETEVGGVVIEKEAGLDVEEKADAEPKPDLEAEVEVLAEVLEKETLPRTGTNGAQLALLGGLLLLLGGALLRRPVPERG